MIRRVADWLFVNRRTGRYTIGQVPNLSLAIWLAATLIRAVFDPVGSVGSGIRFVGTAALVWWAADEILRGVNPWRRILGTTVLAATAIGLATS